MKIITPGRPKNKIYRAKCHHCGCEFEYVEPETKSFPVAPFHDAMIVKCPQFGCAGSVAHSQSLEVREEETGAPMANVEDYMREQMRVFLRWLSTKLDNDFLYDGPVVVQAIKDKMAEMGLK